MTAELGAATFLDDVIAYSVTYGYGVVLGVSSTWQMGSMNWSVAAGSGAGTSTESCLITQLDPDLHLAKVNVSLFPRGRCSLT